MLDSAAVEVVALVAAGFAVLGLMLGVIGQVQLLRLRRTCTVLQGEDGHEPLLDVTARHASGLATARTELDEMRSEISLLQQELADAVRHVAVVRYDPFGQSGGRQSYSAALLDDAGNGLVLTAINGRDQTRSYAKGLLDGRSEHTLSPEELQAVEQATTGRPRAGSRTTSQGRHATQETVTVTLPDAGRAAGPVQPAQPVG